MPLLTALVGGGARTAIDAITGIFDKLFTSDEEKARAAYVLEKLRQQPALVQAEVNRIEAAHRSLFVAGWRPFIGWVCGFGFLWAFIGHPLFEWVVRIGGLGVEPPAIVTGHMMELVLALLGLGTLRTYEKIQGKAK